MYLFTSPRNHDSGNSSSAAPGSPGREIPKQPTAIQSPRRDSGKPIVSPRSPPGPMPKLALPTHESSREDFMPLRNAYQLIRKDLQVFTNSKVRYAEEALAKVVEILKSVKLIAKNFEEDDKKVVHAAACEAETNGIALATVLEKLGVGEQLPISSMRTIDECKIRADDCLRIVKRIAYMTREDQRFHTRPAGASDAPRQAAFYGSPVRLEEMHDGFASKGGEKRTRAAATAVSLTALHASPAMRAARADPAESPRSRKRRKVIADPVFKPGQPAEQQRESLNSRIQQLHGELVTLIAQMKAFRTDQPAHRCCEVLLKLANLVNDTAQTSIIRNPGKSTAEALALISNSFEGIMAAFMRVALVPSNADMPAELSAVCRRIRILLSGWDAAHDPTVPMTSLSPARDALSEPQLQRQPQPRTQPQPRGAASFPASDEKPHSPQVAHKALINELDELDRLMDVPLDMADSTLQAQASPDRKRKPDHAVDEDRRAKSRRSDANRSPGTKPPMSSVSPGRTAAPASPGAAASRATQISLATAGRKPKPVNRPVHSARRAARRTPGSVNPPGRSSPRADEMSLPVQTAPASRQRSLAPAPLPARDTQPPEEKN